jgi:hypothetical protein
MIRKVTYMLVSSILFLCVTFCTALKVQASEVQALEYEVKAAYLYNFAKFVEWPPQAFADNESPIVIGVLGENPFGDILEATVQSQTLHGRSILIKQSRNVEDLKTCQLLFVSQSEQNSVREVLNQLRGASVLTVSDMESFIQNGGIIHFVKKENKIRFEINQEAAKEANLKISSKLLSLAVHP